MPIKRISRRIRLIFKPLYTSGKWTNVQYIRNWNRSQRIYDIYYPITFNKMTNHMKILVVDDELDIKILFQQRFRREIRAGQFEFSFMYSGE